MSTYTQISSGGVYGNGAAICTTKYAAIIASGGVYGNGHGAILFPNINGSGGVYGNGTLYVAPLIFDTFNSPPRPTIVFQVSFFSNKTMNSYPQPDSLSNISLIQAATKINIPGIADSLKNGDQFTLYGQDALRVKTAYASVLTIISTS